MHDQLIAAIVKEIAPVLTGQTLGKVWQLARAVLVFDLHLRAERYLFIAVEPNEPRLYLVRRRVRELEQQARVQSAKPGHPTNEQERAWMGGSCTTATPRSGMRSRAPPVDPRQALLHARESASRIARGVGTARYCEAMSQERP